LGKPSVRIRAATIAQPFERREGTRVGVRRAAAFGFGHVVDLAPATTIAAQDARGSCHFGCTAAEGASDFE
jgi:hypothetical protein